MQTRRIHVEKWYLMRDGTVVITDTGNSNFALRSRAYDHNSIITRKQASKILKENKGHALIQMKKPESMEAQHG